MLAELFLMQCFPWQLWLWRSSSHMASRAVGREAQEYLGG